MKVGILTFHEGINHGAFMQAFSTYQFLLQNGYDVEIINYKNKIHYLKELRAFLITKNPLKGWENFKKIKAFKADHQAMNLAPLSFDLKTVKGKYDAVVIGSDIVWNFKDKFLGSDPIYFGKGLENSKLISYAPSFGNVDINDTFPSFVIEGLKNFANISVRDNNSAQIVKKVIGYSPDMVLDPTFLIDSVPFERQTVIKKPFLLVYAYALREKEISSAIMYARDKGLEIVSIGYKNGWADKNIIDIGPFEWLSYFNQASAVLTSTFHGTIFSLKYKKNFVTSMNDNIKNKTISLISHLVLENRFVNNTDVRVIFEQSINYSQIDQKLDPLVEASKNYLLESLR